RGPPALRGQAARSRLLCRVEKDLWRRGMGDPGGRRRPEAGLMKAAPAPQATGGAQAVARALSLLSLVGRGGNAGLALGQLAAASGLTRPTVRRLLLALAQARMVEQDRRSRRYHLGPEAYLLGTFAAERHGILHHARDSMLRLADETGDT